ncbi:gamma-butyrobetaine hydroxylase-like domain-containing protein [Marinomonas posidonica]|uniref:Gamma-butyrobetaine hydroxylase-like N-terminal domain-containing protein n=1 Tax=Marinomonas posidonica (strain CECT 7376 / NCIMB 14433 / IVIA-Po-181) TaxID=491952 RepID=F6CT87_MARPP|nr:DUF971 domain-containing protein [Marinomonas posidonica]AEF56253.1 protein of unknown function DUF971 [Marinomonas posidonica IVIA-Po-181]
MLTPTKIHYHKQSRELELAFSDGQTCQLSAEFLRVHSPSAEVRGHGAQMPILQYGKKDVFIQNIEGAGNYALKITFDDGHDSGLYTWEYLHNLGKNHDQLWQMYLARLEKEGKTRDTSVIQIHQS